MKRLYSRRQFLQGLGTVFTGLTVASCAGSAGEPHYTVVIGERNRYEPATLVVPLGAKVAWKNNSVSLHTVTGDPALAQSPTSVRLPPDAQPWDSGHIYSGQIWTHTFTVPGDYVYFSRYYEADGMVGVIQVVE